MMIKSIPPPLFSTHFGGVQNDLKTHLASTLCVFKISFAPIPMCLFAFTELGSVSLFWCSAGKMQRDVYSQIFIDVSPGNRCQAS